MAYKHVLSQYVFNNDTLDSTYIIKLTGIMINLQTAALKLQNIKVCALQNDLFHVTLTSFDCIVGNIKGGLHRVYQ